MEEMYDRERRWGLGPGRSRLQVKAAVQAAAAGTIFSQRISIYT